MKKINQGGPAFPSAGLITTEGVIFEGMTLREWFAGQAMRVLLDEEPLDELNYEAIARHAYNLADVMIQGREEGWL